MLSLLRRWFQPAGNAEREFDDELAFHIQMDIDQRIAAGTEPNEARRQALALFGSPHAHKDGMREARRSHWLEESLRDARLALRAMRRAPAFTMLVVVTLGIGIGASTAVWALIDGIVLRPLAYANADRLFLTAEATSAGDVRPISYQGFLDRKREVKSLDKLALVHGTGVVVADREGPRQMLAAYVTEDFFPALGTPAQLGRTFAAPAGERPAVLSWSMWQSQFGGSRDALGATLRTLDGSFTVVGVMPRSFREPVWADFWIPFDALPAWSDYVRTQRNLHVDAEAIARLAPNATRQQAMSELSTVAKRLAQAFPDDSKSWTEVRLDPLRDAVLGDAASRLRLLALVVSLVLLVTCVNVAGLLISRHAARAQEISIRAALGARQGRLVRQLIVESAALAIAGAILGIAIASFGLEAIRRLAPTILPRIDEVSISERTMLFTVGVTAVATMLLGLLPARAALRFDLAASFRRGSVGAARGSLRHVLVVVQFALALCIVLSAGMLARTLMKLSEIRLGLDPEGVATLRINPSTRYASPEAARELYRRLREEVARVPGVQAAALVNHMPFSGGAMPSRITTRLTGNRAADESEAALYRVVSPEYLQVMGGTLKRGRYISEADLASVGSGVVVNEAFVKAFLNDSSALGEQVTFVRAAPTRADIGSPLTATIVGIVEDERVFGPAAQAPAILYVPYTWNVWPNIYVSVRTTLPMPTILPALKQAILTVDPEIPIAGSSLQNTVRPLTAYLDSVLESRRLSAWALSVFGIVTLILAGIGIFGVMAYLVLQSTREIGLRLALGDTPQGVRRWVLRRALRLAGAGIVGGLVIAAAGVRILKSQLTGIAASDPVVFVATALLFAAVAVAAALLPALNAARVDPMTMLRAD